MGDIQITLSLPEALWAQLQATHIDVQRVAIQALEHAVQRANRDLELPDVVGRIAVIAEPRPPTQAVLDEMDRQVRTELHSQFGDEPQRPKG